MAFTGTVSDTVFCTLADFMSIKRGMGMDASAVAGKCEAVLWDEPVI